METDDEPKEQRGRPEANLPHVEFEKIRRIRQPHKQGQAPARPLDPPPGQIEISREEELCAAEVQEVCGKGLKVGKKAGDQGKGRQIAEAEGTRHRVDVAAFG